MSVAKVGDNVKVHYTGKLSNGEIFDSSEDKSPLEFTIGNKQVLKKFEDSVEGLKVGESTSILIPAEEAYGVKQENLIVKIPKSKIPDNIEPEIGLRLQSSAPDGSLMLLKIVDIGEEDITIDANHELADEDLHFDIKLIEIA